MAAEQDLRPFGEPSKAVKLTQRASSIVSKASSVATSLPWSLIGPAESPETWADVVQLFYASLRTGDDKVASSCLVLLTKRFGADDHKVTGLRGVYQEALAADDDALKTILADYNKILAQDPMNIPIQKRRIALLKTLAGPQDAISQLLEFTEAFPTDVEAWSELSELYYSQGLLPQAIFSLEEVLLHLPNAWNIHARLGELEYLNGLSAAEGSEAAVKSLTQAIQRFSRSIELCRDYLRGYYGLKLAVTKLLSTRPQSKQIEVLPAAKLQRLDELATSKLKAIIQARAAIAVGASKAELLAAQELVDQSGP
ncbi:hypothetical protein DV735_g1168, partial [Chaetothyriales sp. CBS 134920]